MARSTVGWLTALLGAAALAAVQPVRAQERPSLMPGQRVRVTASSAGMDRSSVILEAISGDTLVLLRVRGPGDTVRSRVALGAARSVEVSAGRRSAIGPAVGVGAGLGMLVGAVIGATKGAGRARDSWTPCKSQGGWFDCVFYPSREERAAEGGITGGFNGALIGLGVGAASGLIVGLTASIERWVQVPLDGVRPTLARLPGDCLGLGAALAF